MGGSDDIIKRLTDAAARWTMFQEKFEAQMVVLVKQFTEMEERKRWCSCKLRCVEFSHGCGCWLYARRRQCGSRQQNVVSW